jgi:L-lactate utilization protein LutB
MKEFNKSFYKFSEKFREKREKTESTLFNINELKEEAKEQKLVLISNESATL